jgi:V/A-type H+-transporting ATPase subunit E
MSGLDNIVKEIRNQAEEEAKEILQKAQQYCDSYMEDTRKAVDKEIAAFNKKAENERKLHEEKTRSGAEFLERNAILKAKQDCISDCIVKAMDKIEALPDDEYFALMEKILRANVQQGNGTICFGSKDYGRLSQNFKDVIGEVAKQNDGTLTIEKATAEIGSGFILKYGEIEENCTLKALFETNADAFRDIANKKLFG